MAAVPHAPAATTWDDYSTESYIGTEVFALISFCIYFLFAVLLVILQVAISDQLGIAGEPQDVSPALWALVQPPCLF
jgi:hypothetical protein